MNFSCHNMERTSVLLKNVSEHLDTWTFRRQGPVGELIQKFERHPREQTTAMVWVEGCENAKKVASFLNNRKLYDSETPLRAYYACNCPSDQGASDPDVKLFAGASSSGMQQSASDSGRSSAKSSGSGEHSFVIQGLPSSFRIIKPEAAVPDAVLKLDPRNTVRAAPARTERMSETVAIPRPTQNRESGHPPQQVSVRPVARATGAEAPSAGPSIGQAEPGSSSKDTQYKCRFCLRLGHPTRACKEPAEYYHVSSTGKQDHFGCAWTRISTTRIKELLAGPVIQHFEKRYFNRELSHFEMRVVIGFLLNYKFCNICGVPGHQGQGGCQLPPQTETDSRKREEFMEMLHQIRRSVPFAQLQKRVQQVDYTYRKATGQQVHSPTNQAPSVHPVGIKRSVEGFRKIQLSTTLARNGISYSEQVRSNEAVTIPLTRDDGQSGYFQQEGWEDYTPKRHMAGPAHAEGN